MQKVREKKKKKRNQKQFFPVECGGVEPTGLANKKCLFFGEGKEQENQQRGAEQRNVSPGI